MYAFRAIYNRCRKAVEPILAAVLCEVGPIGRPAPGATLSSAPEKGCVQPGCNTLAPLQPGSIRVASGWRPPPYRAPPGCDTLTEVLRSGIAR
jgi:hypothetical protein